MAEYPEHDKMHLIKNKSQIIGEFLEWLVEKYGIVFAHYPENNDFIEEFPYKRKEQWLAEFFNIDLNEIENEKQTMLKELREKTQ